MSFKYELSSTVIQVQVPGKIIKDKMKNMKDVYSYELTKRNQIHGALETKKKKKIWKTGTPSICPML